MRLTEIAPNDFHNYAYGIFKQGERSDFSGCKRTTRITVVFVNWRRRRRGCACRLEIARIFQAPVPRIFHEHEHAPRGRRNK